MSHELRIGGEVEPLAHHRRVRPIAEAAQDGRFVRKDYAQDAWPGPPPDAIAWWAGRIPEAGRPTKPTINDDLLVDCFGRLEGDADAGRANFRYVVALLLMRRKRFKFEETQVEDGQETLRLRCTRTGTQYDVLNPRLTIQVPTRSAHPAAGVRGSRLR